MSYALLTIALLCLAAFYASLAATGHLFLDLGSIQMPSAGEAYFSALWAFWGSAAIVLAAFGFARIAGARRAQAAPALPLLSKDAFWIWTFAAFAFAIPAFLHVNVLQSTRITDDEAAYLFSAKLLASGRLYAESHPERWFWHRAFMVNDGKWYSQYFLGWPALLAPGVWLGIEGLMNPLYSALTLPALYRATQSLAGTLSARVAAVLFVTSPMCMIAGATMMSHTSCFAALAWALWCLTQANAKDGRAGWHAGFAFALAIAFFIRPQTVPGLGLPLVAMWAAGVMKRSDRVRCVLSFALPALVMAALFLWVNHAQTGSAFYPAMRRALDHVRENQYLFGAITRGNAPALPDVQLDPLAGLLTLAAGLIRLNFALFGWPSSFLFVPFAGFMRSVRVLFWMCATFVATTLLLKSPGIDTWCPTHFYELSLPLIVLSAAGFERLHAFMRTRAASLAESSAPWLHALPGSTLAALVLMAQLGYTPIRLETINRITTAVRAVEDVVEIKGIHRAVLFGMRPWSPCLALPSRHFVFWPPSNDPDLQGDLLWANHLTIDYDRQLVRESFPDRKGYFYAWRSDCKLDLIPLDDPRADEIPRNKELPADFRLH